MLDLVTNKKFSYNHVLSPIKTIMNYYLVNLLRYGIHRTEAILSYIDLSLNYVYDTVKCQIYM